MTPSPCSGKNSGGQQEGEHKVVYYVQVEQYQVLKPSLRLYLIGPWSSLTFRRDQDKTNRSLLYHLLFVLSYLNTSLTFINFKKVNQELKEDSELDKT